MLAVYFFYISLNIFHNETSCLTRPFQVFIYYFQISYVNPQAPVAQKIADEVIFRPFQGEGVEFFLNRTSLTPLSQSFDANLLENTDLSSSRFHFSVGFISRSCFESDGFIAFSKE